MADPELNVAGPISRRKLLQGAALLAGAASFGGLVDACSAPPAQSGASASALQVKTPVKGGTLVVGGDGMGENFIPPAAHQGWAHSWVRQNVFEQLYAVNPDFKSVGPSLATGHTVSSDGLVYTFQLRKGVKFHDGTPFNADAVEFNFMRWLDKNHPYYDETAVQRTSALPNVTLVKAKDEYTVEIVRASPMVSFIALQSVFTAGIMSPSAVKKDGVKGARSHPVGTGPFVFEKAEAGSQASIVAFDDYWGGRPLLDRVVIRVIADDQAMTASLRSGEVDITPFVDFKDLASFRSNPNLNVQVAQAASVGYMAVNQQHPTLKDVRVRQAVAYAVNKQQIIDNIFYGEADPASGLTPIPMWAYAPQFKDYYKYDPQKAKDLLSQAGGSRDIVIACQTSSFWPRMAELVQADLNAVGFKATIQKIDPAAFLGQMGAGTHTLFLFDGTHAIPDPDELYVVFFGTNNPRSKRWGWSDPKFDELMAKQAADPDQEKRKQVLWDMQKILLDQEAPLPLYYNRFATVSNKRVQGYVPVPIRDMRFLKTYLAK